MFKKKAKGLFLSKILKTNNEKYLFVFRKIKLETSFENFWEPQTTFFFLRKRFSKTNFFILWSNVFDVSLDSKV